MSQLSETINSAENLFQERQKYPLPSSAPPPSQASECDYSPLNSIHSPKLTSTPQPQMVPSLPKPSTPAPIFFPMGFPNPMMDPRALGFPLPMMLPPMAMQAPVKQQAPPPQPQLDFPLPKVETRTIEEILQKIFEKPLKEESEDDKKKGKKKLPTIIRTAEFDWDSMHRREQAAFDKGTIVVRCEDVDANMYEYVLWFVDGHQLLQKYIYEATDPDNGKVFIKTDRYCGWLADEPWSYFVVKDCVLLDEDRNRIGVKKFPNRETVRQHCLSGRENNQFYETLVQKFGAPNWPATEDGEETTTNDFYKTLVQKHDILSSQALEDEEEMEGLSSPLFEVKEEIEDDDEPIEMKYIPPSQE